MIVNSKSTKHQNAIKISKLSLCGIISLIILTYMIVAILQINANDYAYQLFVMKTFLNTLSAICCIYAAIVMSVNINIKRKLKRYEMEYINVTGLIHDQKITTMNIKLSMIVMLIIMLITWIL